MTIPTAEYWDVDGVSLQTMAFDIETVGKSRLAPPPLRGSDDTVPYAPGDVWVQKQVDSRIISFDMWVIGVNEDGSAPTGPAARAFDDNFRKLRQLLWTPNRQILLTKRFYVGGVLKTATAKAQYSGGINPEMDGRARGHFTVDLKLTDPFFYGPETTVTLVTGTTNVTIGGDYDTRNLKVHVDGPRKNVVVKNNTLNVSLTNFYDLSTGDKVDIDVKAYSAVIDTTLLPPFTSSGYVRHAGDASWLLMRPGLNAMVVSSDSGSGAVKLTYQEAWL